MLATSYLYYTIHISCNIYIYIYTDGISANPDEGVSPQKPSEIKLWWISRFMWHDASLHFLLYAAQYAGKQGTCSSKVYTIQGPCQSSISKCGLGIPQWGTVPRHGKIVEKVQMKISAQDIAQKARIPQHS